MNTLIDFFLHYVVGHDVDDKQKILKTKCTIEYLLDCGFSKSEIMKIMFSLRDIVDVFDPKDLPDSLWEDSLLSRDVFYYHHELQLISPPPVVDFNGKEIIFPFYIEMKIRYTLNDLLNYFYKQCRVDLDMQDVKRHTKQLEFLLKRFNKFDQINGIDLILLLIDTLARSDIYLPMEPFDLDKAEFVKQCKDRIISNMNEARIQKKDKIIWRTKCKDIYTN